MGKRKRSVDKVEKKNAETQEEVVQLSEYRFSDDVPEKKVKWTNKQRVLVFASRGVTHRDRHLLLNLRKMLPHSKTESKMDKKDPLIAINEICELRSCNKCMYFENKKKQDLYLWISNIGRGPSAKFLVENVHTMEELRMTGNCLKASRPLLSFDSSFDKHPHLALLKELFVQTFGTPYGHPKSQPFIDHVFSFTVLDHRIWFRNYQIAEEDGSLIEIGPRFVLNPIKIFDGSFGGPILYTNQYYVSPNKHRAEIKREAMQKYKNKVLSKKGAESRDPKGDAYKDIDVHDDVFDTIEPEKAKEIFGGFARNSQSAMQTRFAMTPPIIVLSGSVVDKMAEFEVTESTFNRPLATDSDQDFDPTAEMLINDFDDEHTLDEEEALDDSGNVDEIDDLNKEGEMPLEELLALYGYNQASKTEKGDVTSSTNSTIVVTMGDSNSSSNSSLDQSVPNTSHCNIATSTVRSTQHFEEIPSQQTLCGLAQCSSPRNLLKGSLSIGMELSESDDDDDEEMSDPVDDWRRTIQVGSDYQASVPDGLCKYGDLPAYENEDKLIWDPTILSDKCVEEYLKQIQQMDALENVNSSGNNGSEDGTPYVPIPDTTLPFGCHIRDNEQALFLLLQCGHKVEEALRRRRMQPQLNNIYEPMTSWSEEECRNFEEGLKTYGKDFHLIQKNKVRTRSVSEIVQFYYLWKKTERHDAFASKWRIEKKKYSLHPGTTDYMDRFLDEQENLALQAHSLSSSSYNLQPTTRQTVHASYSIMPSSSYHLSSTGSALRPDSVMESLSVLENAGLCDGDRVSPVSISPLVNGLKSENSVAQCCTSSGNSNPLKYRSSLSDDCFLSTSVTNGPDSSVHSLSSANNVTSSNNSDDY